ncbi:glycosyltransferase [Streptomyces sp. NPDC007907]|uniref:glycosyltransferase n=1 Tax=Streptomyces sp. NPDC007907 TaxID=3364789 RepID=UPI0036E604B4
MKQRPLLICVSGPDGAGKSSLVGRMTTDLRDHGYAAAAQYCYGCVVCRRLPQRVRSRFTASPGKPRSIASGLGTWVGRLHGWVDAAELALRLAGATGRVRMTARGRPTAVVTDRGPLDGLAKFDPAPGSGLAAVFSWLMKAYRVTLLLDAEPAVLAERDGEYGTRSLGDLRDHYRRWAARRSFVHVVDAAAPPAAVTAEAMRRVLTERETPATGAGRRGDTADGRKHVVISTFDDTRNPHYHGGGAVLVDKVARRLAEEHRVTVVTVAGHRGAETRDGVRYRFLPLGWAGPRFGQLLYHALLPLTARRLPHDLWLEGFTPPFSTSFLPLFSRSRVVGVAQELSGAAMSRKYRLPFFLVERFGLRFYQDVVVMNDIDGATVRRYSPEAVPHLIPNGVERPLVAPERFGTGNYIAFLGRVDVWVKGLDLLLAAQSRGAPSMPLLLAGAGARGEETRLAGLLDETGGAARWVGEVTGTEKRRFLEGCAFTVLPSRSETFGIAALESMAYGKPVLHFDLPTLRWMDGGGDVAVPAFDVDALARQLRDLAADEQMRHRLGRMAYRTAQWFSWEQTTDQYLALVRRLLDPPGPSRSTAEVTARGAKREGAGSWQQIH